MTPLLMAWAAIFPVVMHFSAEQVAASIALAAVMIYLSRLASTWWVSAVIEGLASFAPIVAWVTIQ